VKWNTRVLLLNTCTCVIIRKRVWRKKEEVVEEEEVEEEEMQDAWKEMGYRRGKVVSGGG